MTFVVLVSKSCLTLCVCVCVCVCEPGCQAPLSMGFPRQEYWNRLPFPSPGDFPNPSIKSVYDVMCDVCVMCVMRDVCDV